MTYQLYAYCAGTNGSVGQFQTGPFTFAPGAVTNLGTLTWNVPHQGNSVAWEIGSPDRTAAEFRHGDDYAVPGLWLGFSSEFPNPMTYTVGLSSLSNDWNYAQTAYFVNGVANNMVWHIKFNLPVLPTGGNATLNTVWAGTYSAAIQVFVNDPNMTGAVFRDFYPNVPFPAGDNANSVIRQGIHDKYGIDHTSIPISKLVLGTNVITLVQRRAVTASSSYVMYDYLNLELPTPVAPVGLTATAGNAQVALNWTAPAGAAGYNLKRSTTSGGPYALLASLASSNYTDTAVVNGMTYYYVVAATNANGLGVDSVQVSAQPVSAVPPQLAWTISADQMRFIWPSDHIGWKLQSQTNPPGAGLGTNWVTIPNSSATNQMVIPMGATNGSVFFRLVFPGP
jgi:hypothetical protein